MAVQIYITALYSKSMKQKTKNKKRKPKDISVHFKYTTLHSFWIDHSSCLEEDPIIPVSVPISFLPDRYESTNSPIYRHSEITGRVQSVCWLPEELNWSASLDETTSFSEEHCWVLPHYDGNLSFPQPPIWVAEIRLQVVEEQRWLTERGYDGLVVRVERKVNFAGRRMHVIHIHA